MLKNEKTKFFLSMIVVLAISGALLWQGVFVINTKINDSIGELKDKKISRDVYILREATMAQEFEDYNFSKNKLEKINDYFVYGSDNYDAEITSFSGQLDGIAVLSTQKEKSLGIEFYQNQPTAAKRTGGPAASPSVQANSTEDSQLLRLTLKSDFEGLLKFISYIEGMPYYIYIESVSVNADTSVKSKENASAGSSGNLISTIIIKIFRKTTIL